MQGSKVLSKKFRDKSFDYREADTSWGVHGIHPYPAMMIHPIARKLLLEFSKEGDIILDPFMGSGTVLVESLLHRRYAYGIDINPLALLLAQVKTTPLKIGNLIETLQDILYTTKNIPFKKPVFFNINFWFKENIINELAILLTKIEKVSDPKIQNFFKIAFSETVRYVSNTRGGEFKLLRKKVIENHNPDVFETFKQISLENIGKMKGTYRNAPKTWVNILDKDTREPISLEKESINLILTSPPYGDSKTTVAYGQFSRLSLQWLGYKKVNIDSDSLGGIPSKYLFNDLPSESLAEIIKKIAEKDDKRAREVLSFYDDLYKCFNNFAPLVKRSGYFCAVVGNRRVKQITIPTDKIITELCEDLGFSHIRTLVRAIPNKRMPRVNSPTNIEGITETTMNEEFIVVLRKEL